MQDKEVQHVEKTASEEEVSTSQPTRSPSHAASAPRGLLARLVTSLGVPLTLLGTLLVVVAATHLIVHVRSRQARITSAGPQSGVSVSGGSDTGPPTSPQHSSGRGRAQAVY